jgi:protein PhnA
MSHFVCKGSCAAQMDELSVCEEEGCSSQWEMMESCECTDGSHGGSDSSENEVIKDCDGNVLQDGDSVIVTQDLNVKGGSVLKRGTVFKKIRLTDDPTHIDCGKIMLKTCYAKKKK